MSESGRTGRTRDPIPGDLAAPSWALVAVAAAVLLFWALARHPIGDYTTESDFYGGYAAGARLIERGHFDFSRYPAVGPVYELALALIGFAVRDLFTAAKLLAVASAAGTLALWLVLMRRRAGPAAALWCVALLAANGHFFLYGYSATTEMPALFLQSAALFALLAWRSPHAPLVAGVLAALATLTRYSSIYLLAAPLIYSWSPPHGSTTRGRAALQFLAGFAALALPWIGLSLAAGQLPAASLIRHFGFYYAAADSAPGAQLQDRIVGAPRAAQGYRSLVDVLAREPGRFLALLLRNLPGHLHGYARSLIGWPVAVLALGGLAFAVRERRARSLSAAWALGALQLLLLAPVFYSDRYALPLVPVLTSMAAIALAAPWLLAGRPSRPWRVAVVVAGVAVVAYSLARSAAYQSWQREQLPTEAIAAARALRADAPPGSRLMSRKGHVGYLAGLEVVPFPRARTLAELAASCRDRGAGYLYYSWYECGMRPEFEYLLDPTAEVPGLTRVFESRPGDGRACVVLRVGPEFGHDPDWLADDFERQVHVARAMVRVLPESLAVPHVIVLGFDALRGGRAAEALGLGATASRWRPAEPLGWLLSGEALLASGRRAEAAAAFERALALNSSDAQARAGLARARGEPRDSTTAPRDGRRP